jgi:opacity protein-like surface antigen
MKRMTLVAVLLLFAAAMAFAADEAPQAEVFGGYSYIQCDMGDIDIPCNLNGWNLSIAANAAENFGLVADFGGYYGSDERIHSFLFGPKFALRKAKIAPFGQALFGVAHVKKTVGYVKESSNDFAMTLGGGIDFAACEKVSFRIAQAEYFMTRSSGTLYNHFRFSAGIVLKLDVK